MYKMNFYLKNLIALLSIILSIISNNLIVLWLLLFILTFINFWSKNKKQLLIDLILVILLGISSRINSFLMIYKLLFVINVLYLLLVNYSTLEKKYITSLFNHKDLSIRERFNKNDFKNVVDYNQNKKSLIYHDDVNIDSKIKDDLDRHYLQARIRFYGYNNESSNRFIWNKIDYLILIFVIFVFVILLVIGR